MNASLWSARRMLGSIKNSLACQVKDALNKWAVLLRQQSDGLLKLCSPPFSSFLLHTEALVFNSCCDGFAGQSARVGDQPDLRSLVRASSDPAWLTSSRYMLDR